MEDQHCKDCELRFDLKVYTLNRSDKLSEALSEKNTTHVCMAFATEGIAEIGTFDSIGCEMFIRKSMSNAPKEM